MRHVVWLAIAGLALAGCGSGGAPRSPSASTPPALHVTSPQWRDGSPLGPPIACTDENHLGHSPALSWTAGPPGTTGYAVTVIDPDARDFVHWALLDVPATTTSLPEAASPGGQLPARARELDNGFGKPGYGGPCPPPGQTHHYVLTVWALRAPVSSADRLAGVALASGSISATFGR